MDDAHRESGPHVVLRPREPRTFSNYGGDPLPYRGGWKNGDG